MSDSAYLESILKKYEITESQHDSIVTARTVVENLLRRAFGSKIMYIVYSGSIAKNTAVSCKYDVDICVYFKHDSFDTLKEMYDSVANALLLYTPRKQRVSIGVSVMGQSIDVVPARLIGDDVGKRSKLYRNDTGGSILTDTECQRDYVRSSGFSKVMKLMKIWKTQHFVNVKSFILELVTIRALADYRSSDLEDQFHHVLEYIGDNICKIQLFDPANSSNDLLDCMTDFEKSLLRGQAKYASDGFIARFTVW